jgi:hypothetical protein
MAPVSTYVDMRTHEVQQTFMKYFMFPSFEASVKFPQCIPHLQDGRTHKKTHITKELQ